MVTWLDCSFMKSAILHEVILFYPGRERDDAAYK